jgi:hypothetical protein
MGLFLLVLRGPGGSCAETLRNHNLGRLAEGIASSQEWD